MICRLGIGWELAIWLGIGNVENESKAFSTSWKEVLVMIGHLNTPKSDCVDTYGPG